MKPREFYENLKWTYRARAKEGDFWATRGRFFGYDSQGNDFTEKADGYLVRFIFQRFLEGVSMTQIARELNAKGLRTSWGNEWTMHAVRKIPRNEVYVGNVIKSKTPSRNVITGEIDKEWEPKLVKDYHKGIVSREIWDVSPA